ncbi:uncharacterized protein LOC108114711 [Drosophila eugracilis]|uniref:uncharacterized protein LOC108114711 n=1 Tax=Drosophila eugracilis TaxID=29029 RepID=UPI001BD9FE16|nr:uncharacterized protein LOC108114711 [Drosophila eugracilis]XP_017081301.2 uncharacterized protein LOC108114711 [Drosophila eugracilis]
MDVWLQPVFKDLNENKKFSDCRILVEDKSFDCHKLILASASEFFERMFLSDFKESKLGEYRVNDVKLETFSKFLDYVYTYSREVLEDCTNSLLIELIICGSAWLVKSIVVVCGDILVTRAPKMVIGDLIQLFRHGQILHQKNLIAVSVNNLRTRYATHLNCYDALCLESEVFKEYTILTGDYLPEIDRFRMIEAYVNLHGLIHNVAVDPLEPVEDDKKNASDSSAVIVMKLKECDEKASEADNKPGTSIKTSVNNKEELDKIKLHSKYVKTLLGYIKYNKISKRSFTDKIGKSDLLTPEEKYEKLYLTY